MAILESETDPRPLLLMILDGWGYSPETQNNAISQAKTPCWDDLCHTQQWALLETSGVAVGLPAGQMGNSEVGHMNIGAGRIVHQDYTRIENAIADGSATQPFPGVQGFKYPFTLQFLFLAGRSVALHGYHHSKFFKQFFSTGYRKTRHNPGGCQVL